MGLFPKCFQMFPARKHISRLTSNILRLIRKITFYLLTIGWSRLKNTPFSEGIRPFPIIGQLF
jgi:hypothetical protein